MVPLFPIPFLPRSPRRIGPLACSNHFIAGFARTISNRAAIQFSNMILHIGSEIFFVSRDEYIKRAASEWEGNYGNL